MLDREVDHIRMEKKKCPDCMECQMCSESRCRLCRQGVHRVCECELGTGFTYGQYLEWKRNKQTDERGDKTYSDWKR